MTSHDDAIPRTEFDCLDFRNPPDGKGPLAKAGQSKQQQYVEDPESGERMLVVKKNGDMFARPTADQARQMGIPVGTDLPLVQDPDDPLMVRVVDPTNAQISPKPGRIVTGGAGKQEYVEDPESRERMPITREGGSMWAIPSADQAQKMGVDPGTKIKLVDYDPSSGEVYAVDPQTGEKSERPGKLVTVEGKAGSGGTGGGRTDTKLVKQLQMFLVALGFDLGKTGPAKDGVDGDFGDMTEKAVKAFQDQHTDFKGENLKTDGEVGPKTSDALNRALVGVDNDDDIDIDVYLTPPSLTKPAMLLTTTRDGIQKNHAVFDDFGKVAKDFKKLVLVVVD